MHQSCTFYAPKHAHFGKIVTPPIRQALPDSPRKVGTESPYALYP